MQTIWITGGKGFIGRNLAKYVAAKKCDVFGIGHGAWSVQASTEWSYAAWLNAEIDFANLNRLAAGSGLPDVIYHLAGGAAVAPSIQNPYEDFQRTVDTTARLLEWVRQVSPTTKVIGVSSAAVYGAGHAQPIKEDVIAQPYSPYGFHKYMLENLFTSYRETYDLDVAVVRFFSVYGSGLEKQLLWDICCKLRDSTGGKIILNGTGKEIRDWLHVTDATNLLWMMAKPEETLGRVINGGTGVATSIEQVANKVVDAWGDGQEVVFSGVARKGDPQSLLADTHKVISFGFTPKILIDDGIVKVVEWFKARTA